MAAPRHRHHWRTYRHSQPGNPIRRPTSQNPTNACRCSTRTLGTRGTHDDYTFAATGVILSCTVQCLSSYKKHSMYFNSILCLSSTFLVHANKSKQSVCFSCVLGCVSGTWYCWCPTWPSLSSWCGNYPQPGPRSASLPVPSSSPFTCW